MPKWKIQKYICCFPHLHHYMSVHFALEDKTEQIKLILRKTVETKQKYIPIDIERCARLRSDEISWCFFYLAIGVNDTPVFLLNEYIVELNPANFNILNQILNWIYLNWIMFWIEFCAKFSYWIFYWIEFCPKISYWIFYWTESGWKTENQLYFESILWYYTLKYPKNTPKCLTMP